MRKLQARIVDTVGNEITVAWPVSKDQNDSHDDAISVALGFYNTLTGDAPMPSSVQMTTTFIETP